MVKLKDLFNKKVNTRNHQVSLNAKKRELKKLDLKIDDILNLELKHNKFDTI